MEEQEAFPENFSNELYNPVEEVANLSSTLNLIVTSTPDFKLWLWLMDQILLNLKLFFSP